MIEGATNLEDILELFGDSRCCDVNDSGNTLERVGEITLHEIIHDDDVNLVAVLGVRLPQHISLSRPHNPNEASSIAINPDTIEFPTLEHDSPPLRGVPKRVHRRSQTHQ